jgi:hypothetical protein
MRELEDINESSLDRFMAHWYGVVRSHRNVMDERVPLPLARWFDLAITGGGRIAQYYRVRPSDELETTDGLLVFCDDPGGEFVWACGQHETNPPTFERMNDETQWRPTGLPLSNLLLYIAVAGAVLSTRIGLVNTNISPDDYNRAISRFRRLQNPIWSWPDPKLSYYADDRLLAFGGQGGDPNGWQLMIAAKDEAMLGPFNEIPWEWDSRAG